MEKVTGAVEPPGVVTVRLEVAGGALAATEKEAVS